MPIKMVNLSFVKADTHIVCAISCRERGISDKRTELIVRGITFIKRHALVEGNTVASSIFSAHVSQKNRRYAAAGI